MSSQNTNLETRTGGLTSVDKVNIASALTLLVTLMAIIDRMNIQELADVDYKQFLLLLSAIAFQLKILIENSKSSPNTRGAQPEIVTSDLSVAQPTVESAPPSLEQSLVRKHLEPRLDLGKLMALFAGSKVSFQLIGNFQEIYQIAHISQGYGAERIENFHPSFKDEVFTLCREACANAPQFVRDQIEQRVLPNIEIKIGKYNSSTGEAEVLLEVPTAKLAHSSYEIELPPSDSAPVLGSCFDWGKILTGMIEYPDYKDDFDTPSIYIHSLLNDNESPISPDVLPMPCATKWMQFLPKNVTANEVPIILTHLKTYMPNKVAILAPIEFPVHPGNNTARAFRVLDVMLNPLLKTINDARFQVVWVTPNGTTRTLEVKMVIVPFYSDKSLDLGFTYEPVGSAHQEYTAGSPEAEWFKKYAGVRSKGNTQVFVIGAENSQPVLDALDSIEVFCDSDQENRFKPFRPLKSGPRDILPQYYYWVLDDQKTTSE